MRIRLAAAIVLFCFTKCLAFSQTPLQIAAIPPQTAILGQNYTLPLVASGGSQPYTWQVEGGNLPPGLKLHSHAGSISGVPATAGEYHFTLVLVDYSVPKLQIQRDVTIQVIAGLSYRSGKRASGSAWHKLIRLRYGDQSDWDRFRFDRGHRCRE